MKVYELAVFSVLQSPIFKKISSKSALLGGQKRESHECYISSGLIVREGEEEEE